jgi:hypothetical protein
MTLAPKYSYFVVENFRSKLEIILTRKITAKCNHKIVQSHLNAKNELKGIKVDANILKAGAVLSRD